MIKKNDRKADKTSGVLPEFLDQQDQLKSGVSLPESIDQLQALRAWLTLREQESSRQARPAWMEVVQALISLCQKRLEEGGNSAERLSFETHLVARQAGLQRGERLQTRFVSDEIRRICNHQREYLDSIKEDEQVIVVGWFRWQNRRGLGLALMSYQRALSLCGGVAESTTNHDEANDEHEVSFSAPSPASRKGLWMAGLIGFAISLCLCGLLYPFLLNEKLRAADNESGAQSEIVKTIKDRGKLFCGVDGLLPHFSLYSGREHMWWGMDVELCRALAAALEVEVKFIKVGDTRFNERAQALVNGEVDILFRNTTHTIARDLDYATTFGPVYFYERESFLDFSSTENSSEKMQPGELANKKVCVKPGTANLRSLQQLQSSLGFRLVTSNEGIELNDNKKLMDAIRKNDELCDFAFGNYYVLLLLKNDQEKRTQKKMALRFLPNFGLDPLAPVLLMDEDWRRVVSHTIYALIYADELNINSFNLASVLNSEDEIKKLFLQGDGTKNLNLSENWVYRIIAEVGSYNQIYHRSFNCDYAACELSSEEDLKAYLASEELWPNKLFKHDAEKPGMLVVPRF